MPHLACMILEFRAISQPAVLCVGPVVDCATATKCLGDIWVCISCVTERMWAALATAMRRPGLLIDSRFANMEGRRKYHAELYELIELWVKSFNTVTELVELLSECRVPCARLNTMAQAIEDPQVKARQLVIERDHPIL